MRMEAQPRPTSNPHLSAWVEEAARLSKPDRVVWCDGSEDERARLTREAVDAGTLIPLNHEKLPGCYLHRSDPNDVARVEQLTFICTQNREEVGPTNNWMQRDEAYRKLTPL
ncbi:MAG: phosphoenolpyruvate carboxykinase, partial [Deltaproteobacteria bacterium]|nr:phosphoenolpyruvate carboxykinase [Deltaproteobacteria bacterium]